MTALEIAELLRPHAKSLGMKLGVQSDPNNFAYIVEAALIPVANALAVVDEEVLMQPAKPMVELLTVHLEELQLQLHRETRAAMAALNVRGAVVDLSREDRHTLHEMYMAASDHLMRDLSRAESNVDKARKYQALVAKLIR